MVFVFYVSTVTVVFTLMRICKVKVKQK